MMDAFWFSKGNIKKNSALTFNNLASDLAST